MLQGCLTLYNNGHTIRPVHVYPNGYYDFNKANRILEQKQNKLEE